MVAIGDNRVLCTRSCKMLLQTAEPITDFADARMILDNCAKPNEDDDVSIVFSGQTEVSTEAEAPRRWKREQLSRRGCRHR